MAKRRSGGTPFLNIWSTRSVKVRVFPDPAPATIKSGLPVWVTASCCCGLSSIGWYAIVFTISTILKKLNRLNPTTVITVVLLFGGIIFNMGAGAEVSEPFKNTGYGGPQLTEETLQGEQLFLASASSILDFPASANDDDILGFVVEDENALMNPNHPLRGLLPSREGTVTYRVEKGDTLSGIAQKFGITLDTVLAANASVRDRIQPGQELVILPVSGLLHVVEDGQTVESIARTYAVDKEKILAVNSRVLGAQFRSGITIIVPGAKRRSTDLAALPYRSLPNLASYFQLPATGFNWGRIHGKNGVDVANACGTPIFAAHEGLVVRVESPTQWNGGYGGLLEIEGTNGVKSRYAHTQKNLVEPGTFVSRGMLIAEMGNTGNVHGPSGCHLHFEVEGAQNPLAKQ